MALGPLPLALVALAPAGGDEATVFELPEYGLTLDLVSLDPELKGIERPEPADDSRLEALWRTRIGGEEITLGLLVEGRPVWWNEPHDVADYLLHLLRESETPFDVERAWHVTGAYGWAELAAVLEAPIPGEGTRPAGRQLVVAGLLEEQGWALHVEWRPALDEGVRDAVLELVEAGIRYDGEVRDVEWTIDDVRERWVRDMPADFHEDFVNGLKRRGSRKDHVRRTENYIVLSDGAGGKLFARKLEENYEEIVDHFPFEEVEGRRLMPIYLFQSKDRYVEFYANIAGISEAQARKSKGHAWRDYYATYYDSPNDPIHIHEQTHQIVHNRLGLPAGGSWFQEGLAEYVEARDNDLNVIARLVRDGEATPLRELVGLESLLYSSKDDVRGGSKAGDNYKQSALLMEFLREGRFGRGRFGEFLNVLGRTPRGDVERIEAGFRRVYGAGLDGVEAAWREYCDDR